ncbi:diguanylate phosphodiesterase [Pantoea sp. FDAARGOS_194]|nr:EAL domain-containing protein [Pantoea septica]PNK65338.1 diguanylate phosphodiesterase [Pantoea sp. FDAARGOS_194]
MGRQLNLRQHYTFLLDPVHALSGEVTAWELLTRFTPDREMNVLADADSGHRLFDCLLEAEKWQLFQLQLEQLEALYKGGFRDIISLNVDGDIIRGVLNNDATQQKLDRLPFLRLEVSAFFTERYRAADRLLLQKLAGITPALLWLDDFAAGGSTLSMLTSGLFEYVKTSRDFFWKYGNGYAFDTLLNHVNDFCNGVIVQGVETERHLQLLARKPIVGMQGHHWKARYLADFIEQTATASPSRALKKQQAAIVSRPNFL